MVFLSLNSDIVIVNEFSVKNNGKGSRGSSPGDYVMDYMSRYDATEILTPVRLDDSDDYALRYMQREAVAEEDADDYKEKFRQIQKHAGLGFGYDSVSLSEAKLRAASKDIQTQFDAGKTAMKTVLSFSEDYLRKYKMLPDDFKFRKAGDYRGNVDQMKLRLGIMHGLDILAKDYDNLKYVGVIQVDTRHVHCHLAMVDSGQGTLMPDGTQKGKLTGSQKSRLRRNIDLYLDSVKHVKFMSSSVAIDKRNTSMFAKRMQHKAIRKNSPAQILAACLPIDKRLWTASSNHQSMQRANEFARGYVRSFLSQPDSGYKQIRANIVAFADKQQGISSEDYKKIIKTGEKKVEDECINAIYDTMKKVRVTDKTVHSRMLDLVSMPLRDSVGKKNDGLSEFTYKLRSFSSRLNHHKEKREAAHSIVTSYEAAKKEGNVSDDSLPVYLFFKFEEEYNEKLMCKYQRFLHFIPSLHSHYQELETIVKQRNEITAVKSMLNDNAARDMSENDADVYCKKKYNQWGGRFLVSVSEVVETRLERMQSKYDQNRANFEYRLVADGLSVNLNDDEPEFKPFVKYPFEKVKALDIHRLSYDTADKIKVSKKNSKLFIETAKMRKDLADKAAAYLIGTGQKEELNNIDMSDINIMVRTAKKLEEKKEVVSKRRDESNVRYTQTIDMSQRYDLKATLMQSLARIRDEELSSDEYIV